VLGALVGIVLALAVEQLMLAVLLEQDHRFAGPSSRAPRALLGARFGLAPSGNLLDVRVGELPTPRSLDDWQEIGRIGLTWCTIPSRVKFANAELTVCGSSERPETVMPVRNPGMNVESGQSDFMHLPDHPVNPMIAAGKGRGETIRIDHEAAAVVVGDRDELGVRTSFPKQVLVQIGTIYE
jgi:hypothetical protein